MAAGTPIVVTLGPDGRVPPLATGHAYRIIIPQPVIHYAVIGEESFRTGRSILLPDPHLEDPARDREARATALGAVKVALELAAARPHLLLVVGHTDTDGGTTVNLELSAERAENVRLFLAGERAGWAAHCHERADVADWQAVLRWVALTHGWDCDPGPIDGDFGPMTWSARAAFRATYNEAFGGDLPADGSHAARDWAAYYDLFEVALAERLGVEPPDLGERRARIRWSAPATLACGEHWPIDAVGRDHFASGTNRRVELLFFPPTPGVPPAGEPPGQGIYRSRRFHFRFHAAPLCGLGRRLWVRFPFPAAEARQRPWTVALAADGGGYQVEQPMSAAIEAGEHADLCFDGLEAGACYTLHILQGSTRTVVFQAVPFAALAGLSDLASAPEVASEPGARPDDDEVPLEPGDDLADDDDAAAGEPLAEEAH